MVYNLAMNAPRLRSILGCLTVAAFLTTLPQVASASAPEVQRPTAEPAPGYPAPGSADDATPASGYPAPAPVDEPHPEPDPGPPPEYAPPPTPVFATAPPPPAYAPGPRVNPNAGMGLMVTGFSAWAVLYLITVGVGAMSIDQCANQDNSSTSPFYDPCSADEAQRNEKFGQRLMIPFAGPFIAIPHAGSATCSLGTAVLGVLQVGALAMGIAGAAKLSKSRKRARMSMSLAPTPMFDGAAAQVRLRF